MNDEIEKPEIAKSLTVATEGEAAERELQTNPSDPARVKNVELLNEQYDDQRLRLDHLRFRLGQGGLPPNPPLREPSTNP